MEHRGISRRHRVGVSAGCRSLEETFRYVAAMVHKGIAEGTDQAADRSAHSTSQRISHEAIGIVENTMKRYFFDMQGVDVDNVGFEFDSDDEARNAAIVYLGEYLRDEPGYASQGHWQVDVFDEARKPVFNIVVATVDARTKKNSL